MPYPQPSAPRYSSVADAAAYGATSVKTIRRRIADGSLTGYRFGPRAVRVDLNELDALMYPLSSDGGDANE